ncbi:STAS domain-containing protein [Streptomyces sp. Qhu_M48]|uniref:STAS domain-containing protein n=1 Tax=Streptomyces sp. Qhu_M48 TaxID=3435889 RepID=UPI003F4F5E26
MVMSVNIGDHTAEYRRAGSPPRVRVVRMSGDLDIHHADEVRSMLRRAVTEAPAGAEVVIDLLHSSFCDSSGLEVLMTARRWATESGRTLRLGAPSHQMVRLMDITGTTTLFAMGPAPQYVEPDSGHPTDRRRGRAD